jgi:MinD superfamily P-loop ATPase
MLSGDGIIISVASGKGGTGKTTVAVLLAAAIEGSTYLDCDVEEPNGAIFIKPFITDSAPSLKTLPVIDDIKCTHCGKCARECRFNALIDIGSEIILLDKLCHSCGLCAYICPRGAISEKTISIGQVREGISEEFDIHFTDGTLDVGQEMATPLVKDVKKRIARNRTNIIDSPPGTSCLMVEAVKGSDYVILVTESTPFGLHDLKLAIEVLRGLKLPFGVVINKYDSGFPELDSYLEKEQIIVLMRIPYDKRIAEEYSAGKLPAVFSGKDKHKFRDMYTDIKMFINKLVPLN